MMRSACPSADASAISIGSRLCRVHRRHHTAHCTQPQRRSVEAVHVQYRRYNHTIPAPARYKARSVQWPRNALISRYHQRCVQRRDGEGKKNAKKTVNGCSSSRSVGRRTSEPHGPQAVCGVACVRHDHHQPAGHQFAGQCVADTQADQRRPAQSRTESIRPRTTNHTHMHAMQACRP